jgi:hypothetical protein
VHKEVEFGGGGGGGSGTVESLFFHLPPAVEMVLASGGKGGVIEVRNEICIGIPLVWGGRDD